MSDDWPDTSRGPCPTVMLWHQTPEHSETRDHIDWLLARDSDGSAPLIAMRLSRSLQEWPVGYEEEAIRIADHRAAYLTYEGPISGNRGRVRRVGQGRIDAIRRIGCGRVELDLCWQSGSDHDVAITVEVTETEKAGKCRLKVLATTASTRYK